MRIFSTFSGIGGFEIGIQNAFNNRPDIRNGSEVLHGNSTNASESEVRTVGYSEIDKYAIKVYEHHFKGVPAYGDITKINAEELPDFDCLVGGFPCQAFSIAGKRKGFEDTRGTLFFDLARILQSKQPRLFVFENVKGLLSHDSGRTFRTIIATLTELGYDCQWQVLNSKNHGVPQNRERVYIVGHLRGTPRPEVFPIESNYGETSNEVTAKGQLVDLTRREPTNYRERNDGRAGTLDANYYKGLANQERPGVKINVVGMLNDETWKKRNESIRRVYGTDGIAPTIPTGTGDGVMPKIVAQRGRYNADGKTEQQLEPRPDDISNTLTAVQKDNMVLDDVRIRRLTPLECERLQGFPDNWTAQGTDGAISDTQRYKMCGNAVTTNVVQAVFERLLS